jgi:PhnB protein
MQEKATTLNPYLTFNGNCREAMENYKSIFNGELELMTFDQAPMDVDDDYKQKIMHATLKFGSAILMASDGNKGQEVTQGNASWVMVNMADLEEAEEVFKKLQDGGATVMPWDKTFWNSMFGMCVDKFGTGWMITSELDES